MTASLPLAAARSFALLPSVGTWHMPNGHNVDAIADAVEQVPQPQLIDQEKSQGPEFTGPELGAPTNVEGASEEREGGVATQSGGVATQSGEPAGTLEQERPKDRVGYLRPHATTEEGATCTDREESGGMQKMLHFVFRPVDRGEQATTCTDQERGEQTTTCTDQERGEQTTTCTDQEKSGGMQKMLHFIFYPLQRGEKTMWMTAGGIQKMLQEAFPADKMQNSIDAAKSFASCGFDKVLQEATKVSDKVAEVDFVQEARTIAQKTDQAMQKGVQEVRSLPGKRPKVRDMVNALEQRMQVSKITEAASTKARALGQDLQPGLEKTAAALQPSLDRTAQAAEIAKEKAGEFAGQMKPRIMEAHENAKKKIRKAASKAAATAAWFQKEHHVLQESEMQLL